MYNIGGLSCIGGIFPLVFHAIQFAIFPILIIASSTSISSSYSQSSSQTTHNQSIPPTVTNTISASGALYDSVGMYGKFIESSVLEI